MASNSARKSDRGVAVTAGDATTRAGPLPPTTASPELHTFLTRTLAPGDRALIVSAARFPEARLPFTDHLRSLFDTLDEIADESGHAVVQRRELIETLRSIDKSASSSEALLPARRYAEQVMNEVGYTVDALERLVEPLAGLPGRKALVHVSSGAPMLAGEPAFHAVASKFETSEAYAEIPRYDTSRSFERVNRQANAHRVVFYTLDAGGIRRRAAPPPPAVAPAWRAPPPTRRCSSPASASPSSPSPSSSPSGAPDTAKRLLALL